MFVLQWSWGLMAYGGKACDACLQDSSKRSVALSDQLPSAGFSMKSSDAWCMHIFHSTSAVSVGNYDLERKCNPRTIYSSGLDDLATISGV